MTRGTTGQGAKGTAASPKSKGQQFSTDALVFELAARHNVAVTDLDWLGKLLTMKKSKDTDLFTWGTVCVEMVSGHTPEVLRRAAMTIIKEAEWLPAHREVLAVAEKIDAGDKREQRAAAALVRIPEIEAELEAGWEQAKNDPADAGWRPVRAGNGFSDKEYNEDALRIFWSENALPAKKLLNELGSCREAAVGNSPDPLARYSVTFARGERWGGGV